MKKFLLSLAALAMAAGVNAEKVAFVMDGSQDTYTGDAKQYLVHTGQQTKEFVPLTADFGQISFTNTLYKVGAFRIKKESEITITPVPGVTITKITGHQQNTGSNEGNTGLLPGFTYDEATNTQSVALPISQAMKISSNASNDCRFTWIEIEYSGTPTGICPPVFESTFPLVCVDNPVSPVSATEGVDYKYKVGKDGEWTDIPEGGFRVQQPAIYYVKAVKGSEESAESGCFYMPYGSGLKMATFTFNNWDAMTPTTTGKVYTKNDLVADQKNFSITVGSNTSADSPDNVIFKDGVATVSFSKGTTAAKIYQSITNGGATDLRYYTKSTTTFSVEEGNQIISAAVCGGTIENYENLSKKTPTTYTNCEYLKLNDVIDWAVLNEKDDSFDPVTTMSLYAGQDAKDANVTGVLAHVYIIYRDLNGDSSVNEIAADENAPVEYYNLQGVRVANPANGLFIVKQGNKVSKRIIK